VHVLKWINDYQALLWTLGSASLVMFIASLFIIPALIIRMPADYFAHEQRPPSRWARSALWLRVLLAISRNLLGLVLMSAGLAMLVLPGQGLLTIAVGFMLIDFPSKYRLERWLARRPTVHRPINWLRHRAGREPMQVG
jgi:archaellum biogenesis protein FlaJ (TadC family)